jgi:hypothetical protein
MTSAQAIHSIRIKPPFFSSGEQASLHRYLDPDFINRFRQDIQKQRFSEPQFGQWLQEETHSPFDQHPVLRLPTHRAFHLVCCEVACERFGLPALDPARITSAGFVIRRIRNGQEQAWILEEGEALGWQNASSELRDPDLDRRLCANGVLHKRADQAAYSGEQSHPLHVLNSTDSKGKRHTLLFGYVPLGGFYYERHTATLFDASSQQQIETVAARSLPWPFGYREGKNQPWQLHHSTPINNGAPSKAMFELLRLLVNRYHLGEAKRDANSELQALCEQLWFYEESRLPAKLRSGIYNEQQRELFKLYRKFHLSRYLQECFAEAENNPLVSWIIKQEERIDQAGGLNNLAALDALPNSNGRGNLDYSLKMVASDAEDLRHQLGQRFREQTLAQAKEIPLPKFGQGQNDLYQIVPFVRSKNDQGKEQIQWADASNRSLIFRVAAPFDPEASRPSLIPMPSLRDLKRGLAKGASILTPGDTFDLINGLNLKKGASEDVIGDGPKLGIQWICSFSLPVITLVAMILLMIMISLLNIVFFWLPWVRICLPFPKIEK